MGAIVGTGATGVAGVAGVAGAAGVPGSDSASATRRLMGEENTCGCAVFFTGDSRLAPSSLGIMLMRRLMRLFARLVTCSAVSSERLAASSTTVATGIALSAGADGMDTFGSGTTASGCRRLFLFRGTYLRRCSGALCSPPAMSAMLLATASNSRVCQSRVIVTTPRMEAQAMSCTERTFSSCKVFLGALLNRQRQSCPLRVAPDRHVSLSPSTLARPLAI